MLEDSDGRSVAEETKMMRIASNYFEQLFTSKRMKTEVEYLLMRVKKCISDDANVLLTRKYIKEEVICALRSLGANKSFGM